MTTETIAGEMAMNNEQERGILTEPLLDDVPALSNAERSAARRKALLDLWGRLESQDQITPAGVKHTIDTMINEEKR
jgi:hypothetical protein